MKKLVILLTCIIAFANSSAQEAKIQGINAKFTFFQGQDTVDINNPNIKIARDLSFKIKSRKNFKAVRYQLTVGAPGSAGKGSHEGVTNDGSINFSWYRNQLKAGDKLSLVILEMSDEKGEKYKPAKTTYSFTFN